MSRGYVSKRELEEATVYGKSELYEQVLGSQKAFPWMPAGGVLANFIQPVMIDNGLIRCKLEEPQRVSINTSLITPTLPMDATWGQEEIVGTLIWGIQGTNFSVDFDFMNGCKINLTADYVEVKATRRNLSAVAPTNLPAPVLVGAILGLGDGSENDVQRTVSLIEPLTAGYSTQITIPKMAKNVVINSDIRGNTLTVMMMNMQAQWAGGYITNIPYDDEVALANDARYIQFINSGLTSIVAIRAIFKLAI